MILATRPNGTRDGELVVVSSDRARAVAVPAIAPTLQALLDDWDTLAPRVEEVSRALAVTGSIRSGCEDHADHQLSS